MKILVTGTAGFIGYHLVKKLLKQGNEVIGLDSINDYYDINLKYERLKNLGIETNIIKDSLLIQSKKYENHRFIKANLEDANIINRPFETENFDAVCNLAAQAGVRYSIQNPHSYIESNIVGFMNILEACKEYNVKNLSYASSSSVYGLNQSKNFQTSDSTDHPISIYAATKKSNEMMAHTYSHLYGISSTGFRLFTCYGEMGRPDMAPMLFADAIFNGKPLKVFNHGNMSRDFTYVGDIVDGIIKIINNPAKSSEEFDAFNPNPSISSAPYKIYNIGNSSPVKLMDFIDILEKYIGKKAIKDFMDMQDGDVVYTAADISDIEGDLGYKPSVSIEEGIEKFVKWYKVFYAKNKI